MGNAGLVALVASGSFQSGGRLFWFGLVVGILLFDATTPMDKNVSRGLTSCILAPEVLRFGKQRSGRMPPEISASPGSQWKQHRACLVPCMRLNQASRMQQSNVWLPVPMFGPGPRGAKSVLQPSSADTGKSSVSRRPGGQASLIHEVHVERLRAAKKSSAQRRTGQPNSVCLQPVWTDVSNQTQRPCMRSAWP